MASLSSQLSEAERERIRLQSHVELLQKGLADAEEGEPLLPMREPFHILSLPTVNVQASGGLGVGLERYPIPGMTQYHLSQWCVPIRVVDSRDL